MSPTSAAPAKKAPAKKAPARRAPAKQAAAAGKAAATKKAPAKKAAAASAPRIQIDHRLQEMPVVTLICRSIGHSMIPIPAPAAVRVEYLRKGERIMMLRCNRTVGNDQCSYCRDVVMDAYTGVQVRAASWYTDPAAYANPEPGTGRIPRSSARMALVAATD